MQRLHAFFDTLEQTFIPPALLADQTTARVVRPLAVMAWLGIAILIVYNILWAIVMPDHLDREIYFLMVLVSLVFTLYLLRSARVQLACHVFLGGAWGVTTVAIFTAGGTRAPLYGMYTLIVMTAVILVGWRVALRYVILTVVVGFTMALLNQSGTGVEPFASPLGAWLTQTVLTVFVTGAAYFAVRQTDQALQRAQQVLAEREAMEAALRDSEERFRLISSITSDYTFSSRLDEDGNFDHILLSGAFEAITGYTPEEFLTIGGWRATVHPDDRPQDDRDMEMLHQNKPVVTEVRVIKKSGELRWVRVYAHPVWDSEQDQLVGINGGVQDVTERKRAEEALLRSESHLRALMNATSDIAFLMSADNRFLTLNTASAAAVGKSVEEMTGQDVWETLGVHTHIARRPRFKAVIESKQPMRWEDLAQNGWWDNSVYPVVSPDGEVEAFAVFARNITAQKNLEAELQNYATQLEHLVDARTNELRHAKEQLELILNNTTDALAFANPDGDIQVTNPAFLKTFENQVTDAIENILWLLADEDQVASVSNALLEVIHNNETMRVEVQIVSPGSPQKDIDLALIPVRLVDYDARNGVLISGRDITQLKDIERFKARFVADAVHDLATPIAGLSTRLYLLKHNPEKLADHIRALENQVKHLRNLLDDLRTLSRLDRRQFVLNTAPHNVNDLVKQVFDTYEPVAIERQQSLTLSFDAALPDVHLDQRRIERVLVNLVSNAINYTPEHKTISIETACEDQAAIIRVSDQGIGISAGDLPHIFDRFFRTAEARETLLSGTGLGLAITKEIVEMHGGTVSVVSAPEQGSTFTVRLPLQA